jgi:RNA-directed DNA polymerase
MSLTTPEKVQKLQRALFDKAKQEPTYRFYLLYDKVYREDVLAHAWALSRANGGAPGVDGQTFADVEAYGVERWLGELGEEVRRERYRPQPVRRVTIPKPGGGERPLGIPTVRDRVVQTAAKLILEPIFEAGFDDAAYGYRPGRSAVDAVRQVHEALRSGHDQVVDADLSKYFDTIPHAELMQCLAKRISDARMLRLLKAWLKAPVEERDERGNRRMSGGKKATRGTPQGGVISPLLANIYMHRFLRMFRKCAFEQRYGAVLVNYADDFVVLCRRGASAVLDAIRRWMTAIGLTLNEAKTCLRNGRKEGFDFLGYTFRPMKSKRLGGRVYLGATPSRKAVVRLRDKVRAILHRGNMQPLAEVVGRLNRLLRGWWNYFSYGTVAELSWKVDRHVYDRVRHFLRRRHKVRGRGTARFPEQYVRGRLGVVALRDLPRLGAANALS